jgi:hypothetical protein
MMSTPRWIIVRHGGGVTVKCELSTEQQVRDLLRSMKTKGLVDFAGDDSWKLHRR